MGPGPVLITGATGLLGSWLRRTASADVDLVALTHRNRLHLDGEVVADLRSPSSVADAFAIGRPSLVIHTAYSKDEASIVAATGNVVAAANGVGAPVIHISTDAVFAGDGRVRAEDDEPDPVSDYGRWKAVAERTVVDRSPASAVVRLPLIVSLDPDDHVVAKIRTDATRGTASTWFVDELRQPALASELAAAIWRIAMLDPGRRPGVWHLPGPETVSRFEIADRVVTALGFDRSVIASGVSPGAGDRPRELRLGDDRARAEIGWRPSPILR